MFLHVISSFYTQKTNKHVLFNSVAKMFPHHIGQIDVCSSNFFLVCKILDDEDIYFNLKHPFCCSMQSVATILNWSSPTFQHCYFLSQNFLSNYKFHYRKLSNSTFYLRKLSNDTFYRRKLFSKMITITKTKFHLGLVYLKGRDCINKSQPRKGEMPTLYE